MTKKHYEALAVAVMAFRAKHGDALADEMAALLAAETAGFNKHFDQAKFLMFCGTRD